MLQLNNLVKRSILFEDATMYYNKWVSGQAGREFATQKVKFKDIIGKNDDYTDQSPNTAKADPVLPYPMQNVIGPLGDLVNNTSSSIALFRAALKNPLIKNDKKAYAEVIMIINSLKRVSVELGGLCEKLSKRS